MNCYASRNGRLLKELKELSEPANSGLIFNQSRSISTTAILNKRQAGRYHTTKNRSLGLTYEQSFKPHMIGVTKNWTSLNSSNLWEGLRRSETLVEDILIRKIVNGFWPTFVMGDVVIKRRANMVFIAFFIQQRLKPERAYFLTGFTEQILSYLLKCPVKLEVQAGTQAKSMIIKYI